MVTRREPGRPRSEASRQAILTAALELLHEVGYARLTIEGIATAAGVGKQTIYRWWRSRAEVLLEAGAGDARLALRVADQGSYAADLRELLHACLRLAQRPAQVALLRALNAEALLDEAFAELLQEAVAQPWGAAVDELLERARARGDLPDRPDPQLAAQLVRATAWRWVLHGPSPAGPELIEQLVSVLSEQAPPDRPRLLTLRPSEPAIPSPPPWRGAAQ